MGFAALYPSYGSVKHIYLRPHRRQSRHRRKSGLGGIAAHDGFALGVAQHLLDIGEPSGASCSTASITPSGPPRRFERTISAVIGSRFCS